MGAADLVPGVSGGTVALILGIYTRFIAAVSALGPRLLRSVFTRELWRRMRAGLKRPGAEGEDLVGTQAGHLLFLVFLGLGIVAALVVGVRFIPDLLHDYPEQMNGLFFGLVLASVLIPYRKINTRGASRYAAVVIAAVGTFLLVGLPSDDSDRARGQLEITFSPPLAESLTLTRDPKHGPRVLTDRFPAGKDKREIAVLPARAVTIPAGATRVTVPVVAKMRGARANLEAKALDCGTKEACEAKLRGFPASTQVAQAAPLTGGMDPSLIYVFFAGVIAISAMVLPGISGSFILLLLGLYGFITFNLRAVIYARDPDAMVVVGVFTVAVLVGIIAFSRFLNWLLRRHHDLTMAALTGLMVGSLRKLWPFTSPLPEGGTANTWPADFGGDTIATLGLFLGGLAAVLILERLGRRRAASEPTTH